MTEKTIQTEIMLALGNGRCRIFRNNVGNGLMANKITQGPRGGDFHVTGGRRVQFGLCPGSSDLIGWRSIEITPDMVGKTLAIFCAVEVKTPTGRPTDDQKNFIQQVRAAGGLAGIARTVDEAVAICSVSLL